MLIELNWIELNWIERFFVVKENHKNEKWNATLNKGRVDLFQVARGFLFVWKERKCLACPRGSKVLLCFQLSSPEEACQNRRSTSINQPLDQLFYAFQFGPLHRQHWDFNQLATLLSLKFLQIGAARVTLCIQKSNVI